MAPHRSRDLGPAATAGGVTPLSRPEGPRTAFARGAMRVARRSLCVLVVPFALTACLDDPPEYTVPRAVPPVIQVDRIDPPTTSVVVVTGPSQRFTIPFRADDQGTGITASFFYDIDQVRDKIFLHYVDVQDQASDPTPFADQVRAIDYQWFWRQTPVDPGAHTLTMILAPQNNRITATGPTNAADSAQVTWFVDLEDTTQTGSNP